MNIEKVLEATKHHIFLFQQTVINTIEYNNFCYMSHIWVD